MKRQDTPIAAHEATWKSLDDVSSGRRGNVGLLAWGQVNDDWPTESLKGIDFGRAPTAREADRLIVLGVPKPAKRATRPKKPRRRDAQPKRPAESVGCRFR